jgi:hypothetical protein
MNTAETIYELVKTLPEEQADLILTFAEFVRQRFETEKTSGAKPITDYFGLLRNSPSFNENPLEIQREIRREWE